MRAQMRLVLGLAGGVDDQKQMVAEIRHHQIVENAAVFIGELGVALPSRRNRHDVLRHQPLQRQRRILDLAGFGTQRELAHMRDVEQPGVRARMQVLLQHAGRVLHRHLVAREGNQLAAARHMERVQGGAFKGRFVARQHPSGPHGFRRPAPEKPKESPICRCA